MNKAWSLPTWSSQFGERQISKQTIINRLVNAVISTGSYISAGKSHCDMLNFVPQGKICWCLTVWYLKM